MKRSWTTIALVCGLIGLFVMIGMLQYHWTEQINQADGEKTRKQVQEQADRFASDFNREIQKAYFNFQTDATVFENKDWQAFNERYDFWHDNSSYPTLIDEILFLPADASQSVLKYDQAGREFLQAETTDDISKLRTSLSDEKNFKPVIADSLTLVLPIMKSEKRSVEHIVLRKAPADVDSRLKLPPRYGHLAIRLDPSVLKEKLLPDLTAQYFGDGEFRASVVNKVGEPVFREISANGPDATASLFDLSPGNFIFYANRELMPVMKGELQKNVQVKSRLESRSIHEVRDNSNGNNDVEVKIEMHDTSKPRTAVFTSTNDVSDPGGPWTLQVQHSLGSIDAYMASTLRRNLAIGFGLLLLLAAAVAAIVYSSQRAKMLAQRQVDFVSSVSHEFRTPLAVIYSAGENLADGVAKENGQVSRYGELIKDEGRKLSGMVEQILEFAGAGSGRRRYNLTATSVADAIDDALAECKPLIDEQGTEVETSIQPGLPTIEADAVALRQAIQNLVVNSVKYGNGNRWIRVSAENGGGKVKISVEDRGIGISPKDLKKVFEPFYRAGEVVDAQIHGNGLGLSLVKQTAQAHNGRVYATSEPGKGSKFTIELPQH